jgi:ABC-type Fe3+/spermidine/putrescine transport system ATPase subunit
MVAGLDQPTIGPIWIGEKDITDTRAYQLTFRTSRAGYLVDYACCV